MALKQPTTLLDMASFALGKVIYQHLLVISKNISLIRNENIDLKLNIENLAEFYDTTIPQNLHNVVTYHALTYIADNKSLITGNYFYSFDLVLRRHITKFSFYDWPMEIHSMFYTNLPKLKDLKILYLNLKNMENEHLSHVLEGIEGMKQLEIFRCKGCDDSIVEVLCDNCPLKSLNFDSSERFVTDKSVPSILKLKNLKKLDISGTDISKEGQKQLLLGLSHLETLMSKHLNLVLQEMEEREFTLLQNVVYDFSNERDVTNLIKYCPSVKELQIPEVKSVDLSDLANLKNLTGLDASCDFYSCNIHNILETRGYQITKLSISSLDVSVQALLMIDNSCPNLIRLSTTVSSFSDDEIRIEAHSKKCFQNLLYFSISSDTEEDGTFCLVFILCNCLKIKEILFLAHSDIIDINLDEIFCFNPLVNLQKFLFMGESTYRLVEKLLTECKQLRYLGTTAFWPYLPKWQIPALKDYIKTKNLNVEFLRTAADSQPSSLMLL